MSSPGTAKLPDPDFWAFEEAERGQIPDGPGLQDIHTVRGDIRENDEAFFINRPPQSNVIAFPYLLSGRERLNLSKEALEAEIDLILEMRTGDDFDDEPALYSVTVRQPQPFRISDDWLPELSELPNASISNARAGYLVHNDLYALQSDPNKLHDLVSIFLDECDEVEVKLKGRDDSIWRIVTVRLTG